MQIFAQIALYAWLPIVILLFHDMGGYRAMAHAYVAAWLFLPTLDIKISGLPDYNKVSATSVGVALASFLFESRVWLTFQPRWWDLPVVLTCLIPIPSSLYNGLGLWDGCSGVMTQVFIWGLPYFLGRLYFDSFDKLRTLARAIFWGGIVYIPFCLVELRMSPQFSNWVYAIPQRVGMELRYGGWRPCVFLSTGLELGMWMTAACLMGFMLWYSKSSKSVFGISEGWLLCCLFPVTVLCKSTAALLFLMIGVASFVAVRRFHFRLIPVALMAVPIVYMVVRTNNQSDGSSVIALASSLFGPDRAQSLEFRFDNENILAARARQSLLWGWGGWGRNLIYDETGKVISIVDGWWIIHFGTYGLAGLVTFYTMLLAAPTASCLRFGKLSRWNFRDVAPVLGLALFLLVYAIDTLLNAMVNAVYPVALGALTSVLVQRDEELMPDSEEFEDDWGELPAVTRRLWPPPTRPKELEIASS